MSYVPPAVSVADFVVASNLDRLTATARLALTPDLIPDSLKSLPQWTCWRYRDKGKGKPDKPPINARTGGNALSNNPATWSSFEVALNRFNSDPTVAGLNFILKPADLIVALDIDDYGNPPDPDAVAALGMFTGTYAERSPSGGLHIFAFGKSPVGGLKANGMFEVKRALTVTGNRIDGHAADLTEQQLAIDCYHRICLCKPEPDSDLHDMDCLSKRCPACGAFAEYPDCESCGYDFTLPPAELNPTDTKKKVSHSPLPPIDSSFVSVGSSVDYAQRLALALKNEDTARLYHGDNSAYGNDRSIAEQALALHLMTFADGDTGVVAGWLNGSQCGKWLERGNKGTDVYRRNTLAAALKGWDRKPFVDKRQADIDHGRMLSDALMKGRRDKAGQAGHSGESRSEQPDNEECPVDKKPLFMDAADLLLNIQPPQWLIKRFVSADSLTTLFGSPGSGKSFIAIDMACSVASGQDWNGNRTATGQVLYIAGEGHVGFGRRLTAWQGVHGAIPHNRLFVSTRSIAFNAAGLQAVLDAIAELSDVPVLIVIDTLATVIDGNENDAADMARFIRALKAMQVRTQAAVLVVHHTGHGDKTRARGHSSLNGAIDTELKLERADDGNGTMSCTKQKDAEPPAPVGFELSQYAIGEDEDGDPITSCTVSYSVADASTSKQRKPSTSQVIALRALHTALVDHGGTFSGQFAVHIEDWRKAAYDGGIADTPDAKKKAFQRTRTALIEAGDVKCNEDLYWLADTGKQGSARLLNTEKRKQQAAND